MGRWVVGWACSLSNWKAAPNEFAIISDGRVDLAMSQDASSHSYHDRTVPDIAIR